MDASTQLRAALFERYPIEREIGTGGMATVYLARDVRHNRKVALKVVKPELGAVLGTERFLAEIQVTANLQHPHLLPLFDSGEADGLLFYVMPFVEGESLRDRLEREGQLPVDQAVRIAVAVLSALDYAHRHGVIHRDLKPENILLHDGQPVVADFGIALAISRAGGNRITQTGWSLGTPQYMSPEQATGDRKLDARSDLYSLAAVLYEMLTGEALHSGHTIQAVMAKILVVQPQPVRHLRAAVPEHVDGAILRALAKLPADRFSSASEFADELLGKRVIAGPKTRTPLLGWPRSPMQAAALLAAAILLALVAWNVGAFGPSGPAPPGGPPVQFVLSFADSVSLGTMRGRNLAISRDGTQLAFVGVAGARTGIVLNRLADRSVRWLEGTDGASNPVFSPDGSALLVSTSDSTLKRIPLSGGSPITVLDGTDVYGLDWHERSGIVLAAGGDAPEKGIWRILDNGSVVRVAAVDSTKGHLFYAWPHVLPDGKSALITIWKKSHEIQDAELGLVRLRDGRVTELGIPGTDPRYVPSGYIVFGRWHSTPGGTLYAAPFSSRRKRLRGRPVDVHRGVIVDHAGSTEFATSETGLIVFRPVVNARDLLRVTRAGEEQVIHLDSQIIEVPRVSPDGRRIALARLTVSSEIWIHDRATAAFTPMETGSGDHPEWSPDGQRLLYVRNPSNDTVLWKPWDGSGTAQTFMTAPDSISEVSAGRQRTVLAMRSRNSDIWLAPPDSPHALRPFLATPALEVLPQVSPSGRLLAYVSDVTGTRNVFITPIPGPGRKLQVSTGGGDEPIWAPNGRELFYRSPRHLIAARISESPGLDVLGHDTLFADAYERHFSRANYDVFPNGEEFVFVRRAADVQSRLMGVVNWPEELRRRLGR